jgi:magnesium transporter
MPRTTPAANHKLGTVTPAVSRLVSATGAMESATPRDVEQRLSAGGFFWLDLESLDPGRLEQFGRSLRLDASAVTGPQGNGQSPGAAVASTAQRPTLAAFGDSIQGLVPAASGPAPADGSIPVRIVYTAEYLLTSHSGPCQALEQARHRYDALRQEGKADGPLVLFLVLDDLAGSFEPQILALDARLGEIQVELETGLSLGAQAEVLAIRRRLADDVQSLGWYAGDLDNLNAGGVGQLPGMSRGAQPHFDRHHHRITRMRDATRDYREEAGDVLGQFSTTISNRQEQMINFLTVISVIFQPLTFFTGYFGMNFGVITQNLTTVWTFILLGNVLPAAFVVLGIVLFRRLVTRVGYPSVVPARRPDR